MSLFNTPSVASINPDANYDADTSHDNGHTWKTSNRGTNCGEMVQIEMVSAIEEGRAFQTNGPVVTIDSPDGSQTRWVPRA